MIFEVALSKDAVVAYAIFLACAITIVSCQWLSWHAPRWMTMQYYPFTGGMIEILSPIIWVLAIMLCVIHCLVGATCF